MTQVTSQTLQQVGKGMAEKKTRFFDCQKTRSDGADVTRSFVSYMTSSDYKSPPPPK